MKGLKGFHLILVSSVNMCMEKPLVRIFQILGHIFSLQWKEYNCISSKISSMPPSFASFFRQPSNWSLSASEVEEKMICLVLLSLPVEIILGQKSFP